MWTRIAVFTAFVLIAVAPQDGARAEQQRALSLDDWAARIAPRFAGAAQTVEYIRRSLLREFWSTDVDGGGVSESDYRLLRQFDDTNLRAGSISHRLQYDVDGDGVVTRAELELKLGDEVRRRLYSGLFSLADPTDEKVAREIAKAVDRVMKEDTDGDGRLTFQEILAASRRELGSMPIRQSEPWRISVPLSLDLNKDGIVTESEFMEIVDRILLQADSDRDGKISPEEFRNFSQRALEATAFFKMDSRSRGAGDGNAESDSGCNLPKPSAQAQVLVLAAEQGNALSTVALGDEDEVVTVADVIVQPGAEPLYLVLASRLPVIWRLTGLIDRVERVVAGIERYDASGAPRTGVIGVPRDHVAYPAGRNCMATVLKTGPDQKRRAADWIKHLIGRPADDIIQRASISTIRLPSGLGVDSRSLIGAVDLPHDGAGAPLWKQVLQDHPGGVVRLDPGQVLSRATAKSYDVLPQAAGLAQLVDQGALKVTKWARVIRVGNDTIYPGGGNDTIVMPPGAKYTVGEQAQELTIVKKIRFPGGFSSMRPLIFVLAPGVPEPDGSPGRSIVRR
jgi:Ca2+-binding EF-hand superfamily protein